MLDPHNDLVLVHPDLVKVMRLAAQNLQPFQIVYGIRTMEAERAAVASGHSTTMHSRHLPDPKEHNLACAVDVAAMTGGKIDWSAPRYPVINAEVQSAAKSLHIPVEWGGAWAHLKDLGHFQLPWTQYP